jgi:serine/threonine-protein kinase
MDLLQSMKRARPVGESEGMGVVLRVTGGCHQGQEFLIDRAGHYIVGRASYADFALSRDSMLSREHFQMEVEPPFCHLVDLGSTNGTKVNQLRVERVRLREGDLVTAGDSAFMVHFTSSEQQPGSPGVCAACESPLGTGGIIAARVGDWSPLPLDSAEAAVPFNLARLCEDCEARRARFPQTHPDFVIEALIGEGGMGEVYRAWQISRKRRVAIKMMIANWIGASGGEGQASPQQQKAFSYFRREIVALRDMLMPGGRCHPNIVEFYDLFEVNGQFQLVMEYVDGKNALHWVRSFREPLPIESGGRIALQLLAALHYAHTKGYVHRDVKPSNLLVIGPLHRPRCKLSDFGLAKNFVDSDLFTKLTRLGDVGGSIGFLSPEHIREFGEVKAPADIYCTAVTVFYLLTGKYPYLNFDPQRPDSYEMILEHPAVPLRAFRPDAPSSLERILLKALKKQPRDRWQTAKAMWQAIEPLASRNRDRGDEPAGADSSLVS